MLKKLLVGIDEVADSGVANRIGEMDYKAGGAMTLNLCDHNLLPFRYRHGLGSYSATPWP